MFSNAVVCIVLIFVRIPIWSNLFFNDFGTVPKAPITIGVAVTFVFHSTCNSLAKSWYFSLFSLSFISTLWSGGIPKSTIWHVFFSLSTIMRSGLLASIWWSVCTSKSHNNWLFSFSSTDSGLCSYHLSAWLNSSCLHNSQWIVVPTKSCLFLYSFCASFVHSQMMCITV